MSWRDTMAQVLQGVMLPPQIPPNFQTPQSSIPLPPLGRFGMEALNMAGLPSSIPRRMVTPAELIRRLPAGTQVPSGGSNDRAAPVASPGGGTVDAILNGGMIPPTTETGIPIVAGSDSRIVPHGPESEAPTDYSDPSQVPPFVYVPDPPYTYETPPNPPDSPAAVAVPPAHEPAPYFPDPTYVPEPDPIAPWAPYVPGAKTIEHSTTLDTGTVGDLLPGSSSSFDPTVMGTVADPIGTATAWLDNLADRWKDQYRDWDLTTPLHRVDPMDSWGSSSYGVDDYLYDPYDPFNLSNLTRAQRQHLYDIGYLKDA